MHYGSRFARCRPIQSEPATLTLTINVARDEANAASRWSARGDPADPTRITLTLFNLNSPLGGGPSQAVPLWNSPSFGILLQLKVYTSDNSPPLFLFSLYRRPVAAQPTPAQPAADQPATVTQPAATQPGGGPEPEKMDTKGTKIGRER